MNKDLIAIFEYLEREKGIKREIVINAISDSLRAAARKSIKGLGEKQYQQLYEINSLDFVLLFIPIEPAFLESCDWGPGCSIPALQTNVRILRWFRR